MAGWHVRGRRQSGKQVDLGSSENGEPNNRLPSGADPVSDPRLAYSINETARILSISRATVYKAVDHKLLTKIELFGKRLITRASIDDLLAGKKGQ